MASATRANRYDQQGESPIRPARPAGATGTAWPAPRPAGTATGTTAVISAELLGERFELFSGYHAILVRVGLLEEAHQARVGDLVLGELAVHVLVEGHHPRHEVGLLGGPFAIAPAARRLGRSKR